MADFLLEIGTEEIPASMVYNLAANLGHNVSEALAKQGIRSSISRPSTQAMFDFEVSSLDWRLMDGMRIFGASRRLGFLICALPVIQADRQEVVVGPAMAVARDASGKWTKAAEGFARKQGVELTDCLEVQGPKGPCVGFERTVKGRPTSELIAEIVPSAVDALYLPKSMSWGGGSQTFVRPVRWVVALLDDDIVPLEVKGVAAGRLSRGHRIHGAPAVEIASAGSYFESVRQEHVLADPKERELKITRELDAKAQEVSGIWAQPSSDWREEVFEGGLVMTQVFTCEYPTVFLGSIPESYTLLPEPIFSTCLREHQKSFAVYATDRPGDALAAIPATDRGLALRPWFLAVMDGPGDARGLIRKGNENVTVSRLKDAQFFYEQDVKIPLERRLEDLKGIVFHPRLGTYYDKALRLEALARKLAPAFRENADLAAEAARLCKTDLASLLVQEKEFTTLQGVAGGLYATAQGKSPAVAKAIASHYAEPRPDPFDTAHPYLGIVVGLTDRLDTLIQFFTIGQIPTGSKDPFALRRAATDVVRALSTPGFYQGGHGPALALNELLREESAGCLDSLSSFLLERARYLWERDFVGASTAGFPYDEVNAVLAQGLSDLLDMRKRLADVHQIRNEFAEDFDHLSVAFKRARNILKGIPRYDLTPELFLPEEQKEGAGERFLHAAYESVKDEAGRLLDGRDYAGALRRLATVRPAVDRFFDDVLVMCDPEGKDPKKTALQQNRLALLQRLVALFDRVADFSEIVPREKEAGK